MVLLGGLAAKRVASPMATTLRIAIWICRSTQRMRTVTFDDGKCNFHFLGHPHLPSQDWAPFSHGGHTRLSILWQVALASLHSDHVRWSSTLVYAQRR
jgi:hypothetical protein